MTHYNIQQNGAIFDGDSDLTITDLGDGNVRCDYRVHIRIGKMVSVPFMGSRFVGDTKDYSGSLQLPKQPLTCAVLKQDQTEQIEGITITKVAYNKFSFVKGNVTGTLTLVYGADQDVAQISDCTINALGMVLELTA
jgi:hypothetical protein